MTRDRAFKSIAWLVAGFAITAFGAAMPARPAIAVGAIVVFYGALTLWRGRSAIVRYGGGLVVALFTLGVAGAIGGPELNRAAGTRQPSRATTAARDTSPATGVTMENFLRLQTGMSYDEAVEILGSPGVEMSRNEIAGITTVMYQWSRFGGANMNAMFQNGGLVMKAQFGLR